MTSRLPDQVHYGQADQATGEGVLGQPFLSRKAFREADQRRSVGWKTGTSRPLRSIRSPSSRGALHCLERAADYAEAETTRSRPGLN
jgi:hypothetical protein